MIGKLAVCNLGSMKGKTFEIVGILENGRYSCKLVDDELNNKYYEFAERHLNFI